MHTSVKFAAEELKHSPVPYTVMEDSGELWATWFINSLWKKAVNGFCKTDMYDDFHLVVIKFYFKISLGTSFQNIAGSHFR